MGQNKLLIYIISIYCIVEILGRKSIFLREKEKKLEAGKSTTRSEVVLKMLALSRVRHVTEVLPKSRDPFWGLRNYVEQLAGILHSE